MFQKCCRSLIRRKMVAVYLADDVLIRRFSLGYPTNLSEIFQGDRLHLNGEKLLVFNLYNTENCEPQIYRDNRTFLCSCSVPAKIWQNDDEHFPVDSSGWTLILMPGINDIHSSNI